MTFSEMWLDNSVTDLEVCPGNSHFLWFVKIENAGMGVLLYLSPTKFVIVFVQIYQKITLNLC